jgi:hypothetical protein
MRKLVFLACPSARATLPKPAATAVAKSAVEIFFKIFIVILPDRILKNENIALRKTEAEQLRPLPRAVFPKKRKPSKFRLAATNIGDK